MAEPERETEAVFKAAWARAARAFWTAAGLCTVFLGLPIVLTGTVALGTSGHPGDAEWVIVMWPVLTVTAAALSVTNGLYAADRALECLPAQDKPRLRAQIRRGLILLAGLLISGAASLLLLTFSTESGSAAAAWWHWLRARLGGG